MILFPQTKDEVVHNFLNIFFAFLSLCFMAYLNWPLQGRNEKKPHIYVVLFINDDLRYGTVRINVRLLVFVEKLPNHYYNRTFCILA